MGKLWSHKYYSLRFTVFRLMCEDSSFKSKNWSWYPSYSVVFCNLPYLISACRVLTLWFYHHTNPLRTFFFCINWNCANCKRNLKMSKGLLETVIWSIGNTITKREKCKQWLKKTHHKIVRHETTKNLWLSHSLGWSFCSSSGTHCLTFVKIL